MSAAWRHQYVNSKADELGGHAGKSILGTFGESPLDGQGFTFGPSVLWTDNSAIRSPAGDRVDYVKRLSDRMHSSTHSHPIRKIHRCGDDALARRA
jgi:hypothetical protein